MHMEAASMVAVSAILAGRVKTARNKWMQVLFLQAML